MSARDGLAVADVRGCVAQPIARASIPRFALSMSNGVIRKLHPRPPDDFAA